MSDPPIDDDRTDTDATEDGLDDLDTETVEDLDAGDEAEDVGGGQAGYTGGCRGF